MRAGRIPLAVLFVISGIALADDPDAPKDQPARFTITMKRKDDSVEGASGKASSHNAGERSSQASCRKQDQRDAPP